MPSSNVPLRYRLPHHHADDYPDTIPIPARTMDAVLKRIITSDGCHLYNGELCGRSVRYPMLTWRVQRRRYTMQVSRLVLTIALDRPIHPGMLALHNCNNSHCCRPDHIREGTYADNAADRMKLVADLRAGRVVPFVSPRDRATTFTRPRLAAA